MTGLTSYHNHTNWTDGSADVGQMIRSASAKGISRLGISDHLVMLPADKRPAWTLSPADTTRYLASVTDQIHQAPLPVYPGIEVDYIPDAAQEIQDLLTDHSFKYHIGSVHFVEGFPVDKSAEEWHRLTESEVNDVFRRYWQLIREAAESGLFHLIAHLDLPKKFGVAPTVEVEKEILNALETIAANNLPVELNTAGWNKPCREAYPSANILRLCRQRDIPVVVTDDAHRPEQLAQHRAAAGDLLRECGYQTGSDLFP